MSGSESESEEQVGGQLHERSGSAPRGGLVTQQSFQEPVVEGSGGGASAGRGFLKGSGLNDTEIRGLQDRDSTAKVMRERLAGAPNMGGSEMREDRQRAAESGAARDERGLGAGEHGLRLAFEAREGDDGSGNAVAVCNERDFSVVQADGTQAVQDVEKGKADGMAAGSAIEPFVNTEVTGGVTGTAAVDAGPLCDKGDEAAAQSGPQPAHSEAPVPDCEKGENKVKRNIGNRKSRARNGVNRNNAVGENAAKRSEAVGKNDAKAVTNGVTLTMAESAAELAGSVENVGVACVNSQDRQPKNGLVESGAAMCEVGQKASFECHDSDGQHSCDERLHVDSGLAGANDGAGVCHAANGAARIRRFLKRTRQGAVKHQRERNGKGEIGGGGGWGRSEVKGATNGNDACHAPGSPAERSIEERADVGKRRRRNGNADVTEHGDTSALQLQDNSKGDVGVRRGEGEHVGQGAVQRNATCNEHLSPMGVPREEGADAGKKRRRNGTARVAEDSDKHLKRTAHAHDSSEFDHRHAVVLGKVQRFSDLRIGNGAEAPVAQAEQQEDRSLEARTKLPEASELPQDGGIAFQRFLQLLEFGTADEGSPAGVAESARAVTAHSDHASPGGGEKVVQEWGKRDEVATGATVAQGEHDGTLRHGREAATGADRDAAAVEDRSPESSRPMEAVAAVSEEDGADVSWCDVGLKTAVEMVTSRLADTPVRTYLSISTCSCACLFCGVCVRLFDG
jgi:hypothetical protein